MSMSNPSSDVEERTMSMDVLSARFLVTDPATTAAGLAEIAQGHPELWPEVATHPQAYPELVDWIARHAWAATAVAPVVEPAIAGPGHPESSGYRALFVLNVFVLVLCAVTLGVVLSR